MRPRHLERSEPSYTAERRTCVYSAQRSALLLDLITSLSSLVSYWKGVTLQVS